MRTKQTDKKKQNETKTSAGKPLNAKVAVVAAIIVLVAIAAVMACKYEGDVLYRVQELNLFLYTPLFFSQQFVVPGGFLTWAGTYFTQYFYHPWMGVTLLSLWWLLLMWITARTFRIPSKWWLLLIVPVALLLITDVDMGYWIYYLKLRGHYFLTTIGLTIAVAMVWLYRLLPQRWFVRTVYIVLAGAIGYPLFGDYGLLAVLLMGVLSLRLPGYTNVRRAIDCIVALAVIISVPLICYYTVYYQTNISDIYFAALPTFTVEDTYYIYFLPYVLIAVFMIAMAAVYGHWQAAGSLKRWQWLSVQAVTVVAVVVGVYMSWYKDEAYHIETRMNRCLEDMDWDGVLQAYRNLSEDKEPTRMMWLYKNVALLRNGTLLDDMYQYRNGAATPKAPFKVHMVQVGAKAIYFNFGQINFCNRWCLEDGVEYGWRADYYRYLVYCSLINGEYAAAQKYIDILKQTKYYRDFAEKYQAYIGHPQKVKGDALFGPIMRLMPSQDDLTSDQALIEIYMLNIFAHSDSHDKLYETLAMACALQMKDIATFWSRFVHYANMVTDNRMPVLVQQAAYLFGHLENKVDISRMPFDKEVVDSYNAFMAKVQQCQGMTEEQMKPLFYPEFGGTYYFDYFFVRDQQSY